MARLEVRTSVHDRHRLGLSVRTLQQGVWLEQRMLLVPSSARRSSSV